MNKLVIILLFTIQVSLAQEVTELEVFRKTPINFNGKQAKHHDLIYLESGRIVLKKMTLKEFKNGSDANLRLTLRSNGDRWDKSGSCFVIPSLDMVNLIDVSRESTLFPEGSFIQEKFGGVLATKHYQPVVELLRFMTPFGVGFYSTDIDNNRRPVYIPKWEKQVVWEKNVSELLGLIENEFYVGVWIDTWTEEGYEIDLELSYSNRPLPKKNVMPLVNTIAYVKGQSLPDFFSNQDLHMEFLLPEKAKNVKLHYTVTGHGGHSGGDEFTKIKSKIFVDNQIVLDTIPWRDDCASFRRFNPTSGVWLKKDSASYIDFKAQKYKVKLIEERIASSDLSRSNWCPGSKVDPILIDLGNLKSGKHQLKISIPATQATEKKLNHWLVSAYLTYDK